MKTFLINGLKFLGVNFAFLFVYFFITPVFNPADALFTTLNRVTSFSYPSCSQTTGSWTRATPSSEIIAQSVAAQFNDGTGTWQFQSGSISSAATSHTFSGMTQGVTYTWWLGQQNVNGSWYWSAIGNSTTQGCPVSPPGAFTLSANAISCSQVSLSWSSSSGATNYEIYRNGFFVTSTVGTSYTDSGLSGSTTYSYFIRATNAGGSRDSNTASPTTPSCVPLPGGFTLTAVAASCSQINLSWTSSSNATNYEIYRNSVFFTSTGATSYSNTGLAASTTYSYYIRATNATGGTNSNTSSATTPSCNNNPNTPTLISPANGSGTTGNWVNSNPTFTASVSDPDGGTVRAYFNFAAVSGNPAAPADQNGSNVTSGSNSTYTFASLSDGKYDWRARAVDSLGAVSGYTGYWRVKKDTQAPTASCGAPTLAGNTITIPSLQGTDSSAASTPSGIQNGTLQESVNGGAYSSVFTPSGSATASGQEFNTTISTSTTRTGVAGSSYAYRWFVLDGANNSSSTVNCGSVAVPTPTPELVINSISLSPASPVRGVSATATVTVQNTGTVNAGAARVRFWSQLSSAPDYNTGAESGITDQSVTLNAGTSTSVNFSFTKTSSGSFTAYALVDNGDPGAVDETNDTAANNRNSLAYTVTEPPVDYDLVWTDGLNTRQTNPGDPALTLPVSVIPNCTVPWAGNITVTLTRVITPQQLPNPDTTITLGAMSPSSVVINCADTSARLAQFTFQSNASTVRGNDYIVQVDADASSGPDLQLLGTVTINEGQWIETMKGSVFSRGNINMSVAPPTGNHNADYTINSNGSIAGVASQNSWVVASYTPNFTPIPAFNYSRMFEQAGGDTVANLPTTCNFNDATKPTANGIYKCTGNITIGKAKTDYFAAVKGWLAKNWNETSEWVMRKPDSGLGAIAKPLALVVTGTKEGINSLFTSIRVGTDNLVRLPLKLASQIISKTASLVTKPIDAQAGSDVAAVYLRLNGSSSNITVSPGASITITAQWRSAGSVAVTDTSAGANISSGILKDYGSGFVCNSPTTSWYTALKTTAMPFSPGATDSLTHTITAESTAGTHTIKLFSNRWCNGPDPNTSNNWLQISYTVVVPQPELNIPTFRLSSVGCAAPNDATTFTSGQTVSLCASISNSGTSTASNFYYTSYRNQATQPAFNTAGLFTGGPLNYNAGVTGGVSTLGSFTADLSSCTTNCRAAVFVDSTGVVSESNESNNFRTLTYSITSSPELNIPTFRLSSVGCTTPDDTTNFITGQTVSLCAAISNSGTATASNFYYTSYRNQATQPAFNTAGLFTGGPLNYNAGITSSTFTAGTFTADNSSCTSSCRAAVFIDSSGAVTESNESNNFVTLLYSISAPPGPTLTTGAASLSTNSYAVKTLNGTINPNGVASTAWFRYWTSGTQPGSCADSGGTRLPSSGAAITTGAVSSNINYTYDATTLSPNTNYVFCAIGSNGTVTGFGSFVSFLSAPAAPTNLAPGSSDPDNPGANPGTTINFTWTAPAGATAYHVRVNEDCTNPSSPSTGFSGSSGATSGDVQTNSFSGISYPASPSTYTTQPGLVYCWWVNAINAGGYGPREIAYFSTVPGPVQQTAVFIDGDMVINSNITYGNDRLAFFIVNGQVRIHSSVTTINAVIFAENGVVTSYDTTANVNQLKIKGAVYIGAGTNGKTYGGQAVQTLFNRNVNSPTTTPAEQIEFDPKIFAVLASPSQVSFSGQSVTYSEESP